MTTFLNLKKAKNMGSISMITEMRKLEFFDSLSEKWRRKGDLFYFDLN